MTKEELKSKKFHIVQLGCDKNRVDGEKMAYLEGVRKLYENLREKRKEELISVLDKWFEKRFITEDRVWHANEGTKRCRPVPIHSDFYNVSGCSLDRSIHCRSVTEILYISVLALEFVKNSLSAIHSYAVRVAG